MIGLIVGMVVAAILLQGAISFLYILKKYYFQQNGNILNIQNAQICFYHLEKDLSNAGFIGMRTRDPSFILYNAAKSIPDYIKTNIENHFFLSKAYEYEFFNDLPEKIKTKLKDGKIKNGSYILTIYNIPDYITTLTQSMKDNKTLHLADFCLQKENFIIISDFFQADLFINPYENSKLIKIGLPYNKKIGLSKKYLSGSNLYKISTVSYYLQENKLMRDDLQNRATAIIDNVSEFTISIEKKQIFVSLKLVQNNSLEIEFNRVFSVANHK